MTVREKGHAQASRTQLRNHRSRQTPPTACLLPEMAEGHPRSGGYLHPQGYFCSPTFHQESAKSFKRSTGPSLERVPRGSLHTSDGKPETSHFEKISLLFQGVVLLPTSIWFAPQWQVVVACRRTEGENQAQDPPEWLPSIHQTEGRLLSIHTRIPSGLLSFSPPPQMIFL